MIRTKTNTRLFITIKNTVKICRVRYTATEYAGTIDTYSLLLQYEHTSHFDARAHEATLPYYQGTRGILLLLLEPMLQLLLLPSRD